ncbi:hypothetical protein ACFWDA_24555 [Rhodococcus zopfii]|uniref:hypothetical protein n=1 Tax=Rhodococcus zopfii TaxID=43772 RepID=UPI003664C4B1
MTLNPTTPEGRTELRRLHAECVAAAEGTWAVSGGGDYSVVKSMWNDDGGGDCDITGAINEPDAELIVAAVNSLPALLDALDEAECEIERQRGDLVIERRRANAAEAALDRVRKYAREQRSMAEELHSIDRPYDALPYDNTATALERIIGDRT